MRTILVLSIGMMQAEAQLHVLFLFSLLPSLSSLSLPLLSLYLSVSLPSLFISLSPSRPLSPLSLSHFLFLFLSPLSSSLFLSLSLSLSRKNFQYFSCLLFLSYAETGPDSDLLHCDSSSDDGGSLQTLPESFPQQGTIDGKSEAVAVNTVWLLVIVCAMTFVKEKVGTVEIDAHARKKTSKFYLVMMSIRPRTDVLSSSHSCMSFSHCRAQSIRCFQISCHHLSHFAFLFLTLIFCSPPCNATSPQSAKTVAYYTF